MRKNDFSKITPCGGCCNECGHFSSGKCKGCLASEGKCIHMWQESNGICKVFSCCTEHDVSFCGLCNEFPCNWLKSWFDGWNKKGVVNLTSLRVEYRERANE